MPNTVTQRTLLGGGKDRNIVRLINIVSDGSEETGLVIYDNSALVNDVLRGRLISVSASGSSCELQLVWDQTTPSPICNLNPAYDQHMCFKKYGGIANPKGTGATGDIKLTTTNLDNGDVVTLILVIRQ